MRILTHRFHHRSIGTRARAWFAGIIAALAIALPAVSLADVLHLKDGSRIQGTVVRFVDDTLTFDTSFGSRMEVPRADIARIEFGDGAGASQPATPGDATGESGTLSILFKDHEISSKIEIDKKNEWNERTRANWIVQTVFVDGEPVYTRTDSTTDKTIRKGHYTHLKNNFELEDVSLELSAGVHHCRVMVRNAGLVDFEDAFVSRPIDMSIDLGNIQVFAGRTTSMTLGIDRGRLRLGKPDFYKVD